MRQYFDDGTWLDTVTGAYTDTTGRQYAGDNSAFSSLLTGVFGTLNDALRLRLVGQPAAQLQQQQASVGQSQLIGLALLAAGAFLVVTLAKG